MALLHAAGSRCLTDVKETEGFEEGRIGKLRPLAVEYEQQ